MASVKATFTLDEASAAKLSDAARRLAKPKSAILREAILDYHARLGRLSERERLRMLAAFDDLVPKIPNRPAKETEEEQNSLRRARKSGGRRSSSHP